MRRPEDWIDYTLLGGVIAAIILVVIIPATSQDTATTGNSTTSNTTSSMTDRLPWFNKHSQIETVIWENTSFNHSIKFVYVNDSFLERRDADTVVFGDFGSETGLGGATSYVQAKRRGTLTHYHVIRLASDRPRRDILATCQHELMHYRLHHTYFDWSVDREHESIKEKYGEDGPAVWQVSPVCYDHLVFN